MFHGQNLLILIIIIKTDDTIDINKRIGPLIKIEADKKRKALEEEQERLRLEREKEQKQEKRKEKSK